MDETALFTRQLLGLLADDARSREWLRTFCDDRGVNAATAESTLILGTLLARSCSVGNRAAERQAEVALARAVARKNLVPTTLHGAARLAAEIAQYECGAHRLRSQCAADAAACGCAHG